MDFATVCFAVSYEPETEMEERTESYLLSRHCGSVLISRDGMGGDWIRRQGSLSLTALVQNQIPVRRNCVKQLVELLEAGLRGSLFVTRVGVARAGAETFGDIGKGKAATLALAAEDQADHRANVGDAHLEITASNQVNGNGETRTIDEALQEILDHREDLPLRPPLSHRVEQRDLCQPEAAIFVYPATQAHVIAVLERVAGWPAQDAR